MRDTEKIDCEEFEALIIASFGCVGLKYFIYPAKLQPPCRHNFAGSLSILGSAYGLALSLCQSPASELRSCQSGTQRVRCGQRGMSSA